MVSCKKSMASCCSKFRFTKEVIFDELESTVDHFLTDEASSSSPAVLVSISIRSPPSSVRLGTAIVIEHL